MLRFVTSSQKKYIQEVHFTRVRAIDSRKTKSTLLARDSPTLVHVASQVMDNNGESDSSKMAFGRVRLASC